MTDRELDALVAEKVMGLTLIPEIPEAMATVGFRHTHMTGSVFHTDFGRVSMPDWRELRVQCGYEFDDSNRYYGWYVCHRFWEETVSEVTAVRDEPEPYSTSIEAAWEVVEKFNYRVELLREGEDSWACTIWEKNSFSQGEADTAPKAIVLAALKAVGVEV
jgi:hypothetical protein